MSTWRKYNDWRKYNELDWNQIKTLWSCEDNKTSMIYYTTMIEEKKHNNWMQNQTCVENKYYRCPIHWSVQAVVSHIDSCEYTLQIKYLTVTIVHLWIRSTVVQSTWVTWQQGGSPPWCLWIHLHLHIVHSTLQLLIPQLSCQRRRWTMQHTKDDEDNTQRMIKGWMKTITEE